MPLLRSAILRGRRMGAYLRLRSFDTETAEGRAAERYRRAAWSALAAAAARTVAVVVSLISIPVALGHLGPEQYGLWVTLSASTAMLAFADFGLGNGLMNAVANAYGGDDRTAAQRAISSAFLMLTLIASFVIGALGLAYGHVPWATALNTSSEAAAAQAGPAVLVFILCFAVSLPLNLVQRIQFGYQEGFEASLWTALGSILSLAGLLVGIQVFDATLPWLVLALAGGPVVANALNSIVLFTRRHPDLRPRLRFATRAEGLRLVRIGVLFFVLQLAVAVAFQSDVVVAARILGPSGAAEYSVTLRLFFLIPTIVSMVLLPLWPAYGEAIKRGDLTWLKRTLARTTAMAAIAAGVSSAFLLVFGREVLRAWLGPIFEPPFMLLLGMALWAIVFSAFTSISMVLNGASIIGFQVVTATMMAATSITASITLGMRFGISGIIWGTLLSYVACTALPTAWYLPRLLRGLEARGVRASARRPPSLGGQ